MTDLRQVGAVPKFRTPRPECHWQKATDGALVMVWSVAEVAPPSLRVVASNANARHPVRDDDLARAARPFNRVRRLGERVAIALLLAVGGYLTLASFVSDHANFP